MFAAVVITALVAERLPPGDGVRAAPATAFASAFA